MPQDKVLQNPSMHINWCGFLHWSGQILPPLLLLFIFSTHGPGFWFALSIANFCTLFSLVTLVIKLINLKKKKYYILRPLLTIAISIALNYIAGHSYDVAKNEANELFKRLSEQCRLDGKCPQKIDGWETVKENEVYRTKVGETITYPITYYYNEKKFRLSLYKSLDLGKDYEGGID